MAKNHACQQLKENKEYINNSGTKNIKNLNTIARLSLIYKSPDDFEKETSIKLTDRLALAMNPTAWAQAMKITAETQSELRAAIEKSKEFDNLMSPYNEEEDVYKAVQDRYRDLNSIASKLPEGSLNVGRWGHIESNSSPYIPKEEALKLLENKKIPENAVGATFRDDIVKHKLERIIKRLESIDRDVVSENSNNSDMKRQEYEKRRQGLEEIGSMIGILAAYRNLLPQQDADSFKIGGSDYQDVMTGLLNLTIRESTKLVSDASREDYDLREEFAGYRRNPKVG